MGLPKPYYQDDAVVIYHADCRDVLPEVSGPAALITDPPYGIGWSRATWQDDPAAYPDLIRWLVAEGQRLGGWCFVFQAMPNAGRWHEWFPEGWRIFAACKNWAQIRHTGLWHSWDPVIFWNSGPDNGPTSGFLNRDYHVGNVVGLFGNKNEHPSPRPLDTMCYIVHCATTERGLVVDPFMGSGTTLRAAKNLGRKAIGIEIEERYCEIAARRMMQAVLPLSTESAQEQESFGFDLTP
ncbi:MAG: site-specific DNA-methyltransferase [SAR202 cluster bacterium]|nr:site-specific DNA-methyltransferase [SAR202 cluster bacterium]